MTIPAAVEEFGSNVFTNCNGLTEIKVEEGNPILEDIDGVLYLKSPKMLVQYPSGKGADEYTIPAGVTVVAPYAFSPAYNLHTITIGPDVERIRPLTFTDCPLLTDIVVDEQNPTTALSTEHSTTRLSKPSYSTPARASARSCRCPRVWYQQMLSR